ncbi:hypothetical protein [Neorhizobium petrolearium]|uniref:hypothetical protein n=1 Tax=Neorhizobium petrolearium TaxID=515361 RepID=UPI003F820689
MKEAPYFRTEMTPLRSVRLSAIQIPVNITEAYRGLHRMIDSDPKYGAAWKLGGTTAATQRTFKVDKLYFGPLHEREVSVLPSAAPAFQTYELKGEAEIALRIASTAADFMRADRKKINEAPLSMLFDVWCVALELPSSPIENLADMGVTALVADRCAAGFLALGRAYPTDDLTNWAGGILRVEQDGRTIAAGGTSALLSPPDICARSFITEALAQGFSPKPGQWISTGGATPCVNFTAGADISVFFNDREELRFAAGNRTA